MTALRKILIIDDDVVDLQAMERTTRSLIETFSIKNIAVDCQNSLTNAIDVITNSKDIELIICDLHLPDKDVFDMLNYFVEQNITIPLLLVTGINDYSMQAAELVGVEKGVNVVACHSKPLLPQDLKRVMDGVNLI